jgi:hypothetical protein
MNFGWRPSVRRWAKSGARPLALFLVGSVVPLWPWWLIHGGRLIRRTLGRGASSSIGWRAKALRWAKVSGVLLILFGFFSTVPIWPWWPSCDGKPIVGDYRDIYVEEFVRWLAEDEVYYWRFGDVVLLRLLPLFDGTDLIPRRAVVPNGERKLAEALSEDQTIDGVLYRAPEEVKRLKKELEPIIGPDPRRRPDGSWVHGSDTRVGRNCRLFRAAILEPES